MNNLRQIQRETSETSYESDEANSFKNLRNTRWLLKLNIVSQEDATKVIGSLESIFNTVGEAERHVRDLIAAGVSIEDYSADKNLTIMEGFVSRENLN
jgi:hypothetical protein